MLSKCDDIANPGNPEEKCVILENPEPPNPPNISKGSCIEWPTPPPENAKFILCNLEEFLLAANQLIFIEKATQTRKQGKRGYTL